MNMIINTRIIRINRIKKLFSEQLSEDIYIKKIRIIKINLDLNRKK
jgi:hypothetical protein